MSAKCNFGKLLWPSINLLDIGVCFFERHSMQIVSQTKQQIFISLSLILCSLETSVEMVSNRITVKKIHVPDSTNMFNAFTFCSNVSVPRQEPVLVVVCLCVTYLFFVQFLYTSQTINFVSVGIVLHSHFRAFCS